MYDAIVIGVGSMGSSTCYHLAQRGVKVLGIEQFNITHENGSHTGESRLIRKAYFEHPSYVPLLHKAYEGWVELESKSERQLYWQTGIAYFGTLNCEILNGVKKSSELYNIPIETLTANEISERWPQIELPNGYSGLFESESGFVKPELAIKSFVDLALKYGASIHTNEQVISWEMKDDCVLVVTNIREYLTKKVIFTSGAFTNTLIKTKAELKVTQQFMGWTSPLGLEEYKAGNLPCWMITEKGMDGLYYGFPEIDKGMKVACHQEGEDLSTELDVDLLEVEERKVLNRILKEYLPASNSSIDKIKRCKYTYSTDQNFIIDQLPEYNNQVILAAGFSGHGFKFVPVVGEALADLAMNGETQLPIDFLNLDRFE